MGIARGDGNPSGQAGRAGIAETVVLWSGRLAGAGLVVWMGWIHLHLWSEGYGHIKTIGPLFMANFVAAMAVALAVLAAPSRGFLSAAAATGGTLTLLTLGALALSVNVGLFGFTESSSAPFAQLSVWVEVAASLALFATAAGAFARSRP